MKDSRIMEIAGWVKSVSYGEIPPRVIDKAKTQLFSVLGSIYAGSTAEASHSVNAAAMEWDHGNESTVIATGQRRSCSGAIYVNSAMSMAHDFDDYLFMAHTGHSAVLVPMALCEKLDRTVRDMILAQIIANEVSGRLGASALLGPLNGQMWTFVHLLGSACSAGMLLGLDATQLAHAIAIALYQVHFPMEPGFFAAGSKLLTAAVSSVAGLNAAYLAQKGLTGPLDVLDHPRGFYRVFSHHPIRGMWEGLGKKWVTDTLAVKIYPGCAYLDSAIDALKTILDRIRDERIHSLDPADIESVVVRTTVLGTEMEELSQEYDQKGLHPVLINFSLRYSIALMILTGSLDASLLSESSVREKEATLRQLVRKISVVPDAELNGYFLRTLLDTSGLATILSEMSLGEILELLRHGARNYHVRRWVHFSKHPVHAMHDLSGYAKIGSPLRLSAILSRILRRAWLQGTPQYDLGTQDPEGFVFPFASRLTVRLKDGTEYTQEQRVPFGAPGNAQADQALLAEEKFVREAQRVLTPHQTERAISCIRSLPPEERVRELLTLIAKGIGPQEKNPLGPTRK